MCPRIPQTLPLPRQSRHPGERILMRRSERINRRLVGKRRIHHVETVEEHLLVARCNVEVPVSICACGFNRLSREVDGELNRLRLRQNRENLRPVLWRHFGSEEAVVEAVRIEDFAEGGRYVTGL